MTEIKPIADLDELRSLYREPGTIASNKKCVGFDDASRQFIAASPLLFVASGNAAGQVDVSPRGGDAGFVQIVEHDGHEYVAIPDLNGNNLIDTLSNVVESGAAATIFVVPGRDDTVRVNGHAFVTQSDAVLDLFTEVRRPTTALMVRADEVFVHCAKAFRRSQVWHPEQWGSDAPDLADIAVSQGILDVDAELIRAGLEEGYAADLAADRPENG